MAARECATEARDEGGGRFAGDRRAFGSAPGGSQSSGAPTIGAGTEGSVCQARVTDQPPCVCDGGHACKHSLTLAQGRHGSMPETMFV